MRDLTQAAELAVGVSSWGAAGVSWHGACSNGVGPGVGDAGRDRYPCVPRAIRRA